METQRIYFDTEFTELSSKAELISIGLIWKNNNNDLEHFYAEVKTNKSDYSKWIKDNVIKNCLFVNKVSSKENLQLLNKDPNIFVFDTKENISKSINTWLNHIHKQNPNDEIEFVSDVSSYDFVLLIDLITNGKTALDCPDFITSDCYNINQKMSEKLLHSTLRDAFDYTREELLSEEDKKDFVLNNIIPGAKHNSLWDAYVIMKVADICEI